MNTKLFYPALFIFFFLLSCNHSSKQKGLEIADTEFKKTDALFSENNTNKEKQQIPVG